MAHIAGRYAPHSVHMADANIRSLADPFDAGPYAHVQQLIGLLRRGTLRRDRWTERRRAVIVAAIAWIPLLVLSSLQGLAVATTASESLLSDIGAYARYLVALPLLLLGERLLLLRLSTIVRTLLNGGYLRHVDEMRFDEFLTSTRRLLAHPVAEIVIAVLAYAITIARHRVLYPTDVSNWTMAMGHGNGALSLAGWWRMLVSQPLFLICIGAWLWRAILWTRLMWHVSRLDLVLVPAHPDLAAGLLFFSRSVPAFAPFAFALGVAFAGGMAEALFSGRGHPADYFAGIGALLAVVLVTAICPLLPLVGPIRRAHLRGTLEYGELASRLGRRFDERWVRDRRFVTKDALSAPDFSATTDLYSIASNVQHMRLLPVDVRAVFGLVIVALLPFLPIALIILPTRDLLHFGAKLLL